MSKLDMTPKGIQCTECASIQYDYRPSSNAVALTVEPQATQAAEGLG